MRTIFGVKPNEVILFAVCLAIYLVIVFGWNLGGPAESNMSLIRDSVPVIGELPPQSISKLVIATALYLMSTIYALASIGATEYRRYLPQFVVLGVLTFLGWVALNFWVISGFLNANATVIYGAAAIVLLIAWGGLLMRSISQQHDATALFLVRFGLALSSFIAIAQLLALFTPEWRSPTQGIPLLYTLTLNAMVGMFLAGGGANMLWRERREQALAVGRKKR
jgi:hypothetical protein